MRLIGIAACQRNVRPIHGSARCDLPDNLSKADQPAIELWRHPDLLIEQLTDPAAAQPGFPAHVAHGPDVWHVPEHSQRMLHRRVQCEPPIRSSLHCVE
jgi:hypothetical protein